MTTTEALRATIVKALGIGVCTAQPCAHASCHFNLDGLAALDTLARRTRDLEGEKATLQRLYNDCEADRVQAYHARAGLAGERDRLGLRVARLTCAANMALDRRRGWADAFRTALAPAEAGTPEPDERIPCGECARWHHDAADWGTAGVCMARLRKLGPPRGEDEYEARDADDGCSDRSERKPVTEEEAT